MDPADSIRRLGFARWYGRRLLEGHAWFVSGVACMICVAACVEELGYRGSALRWIGYSVVIAASAALGIFGLVRYQRILSEAEALGELATCRECGAYARFALEGGTHAHCRRCGHRWQLIVAP